MPTPPPADVIEPHAPHVDEVQTRTEFDHRLAGGTLAGLTVQGLRLDLDPVPDLRDVDVAGTLFVGCRFADREVGADLVRRGANVVPPFSGLPYPTQPSHLYTADDLAAGFAEGGFAGMYDTRVYAHFRAHGGALAGRPRGARSAAARPRRGQRAGRRDPGRGWPCTGRSPWWA